MQNSNVSYDYSIALGGLTNYLERVAEDGNFKIIDHHHALREVMGPDINLMIDLNGVYNVLQGDGSGQTMGTI